MLSTEIDNQQTKQYTYCPECCKLMEVKESEDINSIKLCVYCLRKYRPIL